MDKLENTNYRKNWEKHTGIKVPAGMHLHHINGDTDDNTVDNLALVTQEGHARSHEFLDDNVAAAVIRQWAPRDFGDNDLLNGVQTTYPEIGWENRYSKFVHFPAEVVSAKRNTDRGYVSYSVNCLATGETHTGKMYDKFCKMHGQRQPDKGEQINMMLSFEAKSPRVYLGVSTLRKEYIK